MEKKFELDPLDYKILEILVKDANLPYTEIGTRLDVSGGTVHVRMKKMESLGIVKGAQLLIDYAKILEKNMQAEVEHFSALDEAKVKIFGVNPDELTEQSE